MAASVPYSLHGASYAWADDNEKLLDGQGFSAGAPVNSQTNPDVDLTDFTHFSKHGASYTNPNYDDSGDTKDTGDASKLITKREKQTSKMLKKWSQYHDQITKNQNETLEAIDQRRNELIERINQEADDAKSELQRIFKPQYSMVKQNQRILEQRLHELENLHSEQDTSSTNTRKLKKRLVQICKENDSVGSVPEWQTVQFQPSELEVTKEKFGTLIGGPSRHQAWSEDELEEESNCHEPQETEPENPNLLLQKPELQRSFSIKTSKDSRDVGVSDLVVTSTGQIIIVDKHNKLVKVFDSNGRLQRFIGRHQVKEPIRVTVLEPSNMVVVTDNHSKTIKLFQEDGMLLGTFVDDIKYPGSHCLSPDRKHLAVVEFSSSTVIIYSTDGLQQMSFPLSLDCPAFICSSNYEGQTRYMITDWKHHKLAVYSAQGELLQCIEEKGSDPGQFNQPQGVDTDPYGHIIVADQHNHRIQIFNCNGEFLMTFDNSEKEQKPPSSSTQYIKPLSANQQSNMQLPTAVAYHPTGLLVSCDYQGKVRLFKYLDQDIIPVQNKATKPKKQQQKRLADQQEEETTC